MGTVETEPKMRLERMEEKALGQENFGRNCIATIEDGGRKRGRVREEG